MEREKIIFFRNLFLRAFVVGVVFALVLLGATFLLWDTAAAMMLSLLKVDEKEFGRIVLTFFVHVRLVVVFLFLVPAVALHWTAKKQ